MSLIPLRNKKGKPFMLEELYEAAKALTEMKHLPGDHPNMLLLSEITDTDREKHRRDMWARCKREKLDEKFREWAWAYRERAARHPIDYSLLPAIRRPLRIINRQTKVESAKESHGVEAAE
ncbi:hypothetical protein K438DRAFT_1956652 [Mycena galopus ATCC 62051]|nr:hypothetical protein K438DRAFT_1956652 [Mycena galopus ATCC 62051]